MLENDIQEILFTEEQLKNRVKEIARQITADYAGKEIMFIGILRGSFVFMADLCRGVELPCTLDFMSVSSYGSGTTSSGQIQIIKDLSEDITGRHVIVVEDILDSGNTLHYLLNILEHRHPASVRLCALLDKPERVKELGRGAREIYEKKFTARRFAKNTEEFYQKAWEEKRHGK